MYVWVNELMNLWIKLWIDEWIFEWMYELMYEWLNECTNMIHWVNIWMCGGLKRKLISG